MNGGREPEKTEKGGLEREEELARLKAENEELRRSLEKLFKVLDSIEDEYYELDLKGNFLFVNQAVCRNQGLPREQLIGMNYRAYVIPEERERLYQIYHQVYRTGRPSGPFEYQIRDKDGNILFFEDNVSLLKDETGRPIGFAGVARNITQKKKDEEELRLSRKKYRYILEHMGDGYFEVDLRGNFTFVNEAECRIHKRTREEMLKLNNRQFMTPETAQRIYRIYNQVYRTGVPASIIGYEIIAKDGEVKSLETSVSLLRDAERKPVGFFGVSRDVTERKKAEEALRRSEEKYRTILNSLEESYYEVDLAGNFTFFNEAVCRSYLRTPEELMGLNYREYVHPDDQNKVFQTFNQVFRTEIPCTDFDFRVVRIDGEVRYLEGSVALLKNAAGEPVGFHGIFRDRTERKRVEQVLAESEEKYRQVVENAEAAIFILQEGKIRFANPQLSRLIGLPNPELIGASFYDLLFPEDSEAFRKWEERTARGEKEAPLHSFRIRGPDQEIHWVEGNSVAVSWEGRPALLHFLRDVTLKKKLESHYQQVQKMEAMATLAGGLAHDFNNLLMTIQGNVSLMLLELDPAHPYYERLKAIEVQVRSGTELTRQLLASAQGGKYEVKVTDINALATKVLELFGRTHKEITIHPQLPKGIPPVEVDRTQIEQVLLNLFINAAQAMPGGGDLYVETREVFLDEDYVAPYKLPPGRYVRISVTDTGVGMDLEIQRRVFDPFFTTKGMGRGTGLGLSSAYGIIKNHNGIINLYSEKGKGSTFNLYLPVTEKEIPEEAPVKEKIFRGTETLLFVDDEESILGIGRQLLERLGYKVITCSSGAEAVERYRQEKERIALVILDMIMPGMSGGETFNRLKEINPEVRVILSSGYSINGQAQDILKRGCKGFLQKPFSLTDLSRKVREVLDEKE
jgi:two-component system cell cycle sensor histidine kinase/response regulator CckA